MTKRELAALAFRVVAVWLAMGWIAGVFRTWGLFVGDGEFQFETSLFWACVYLLLTGLLWWKAEYLADRAVKTDGPISLGGQFVPHQLLAVFLNIIGALYIVYATTVPTLVE